MNIRYLRIDELILFAHKNPLSPHNYFYRLFLNEDGRILKNGLSKLHYRFRQCSTLTKTVLLESQYLQSYDRLPDFLRPKFEEDRLCRCQFLHQTSCSSTT